jgi:hypothetical protein
MNPFIQSHLQEIYSTIALLIGLLIFKFISTKAIKKVGKISDLNTSRTKLIVKYSSIGISSIGLVSLLVRLYLIPPFQGWTTLVGSFRLSDMILLA